MNYPQRLQKVIAFIGEHLDEGLSLEQLSEICCLSKFHFHRLFTAFTGLSLQQYIRWLRLKRAAHQLIVSKDESIVNIAFNAGFNSHEVFSRAFKQLCGLSPSQFRKTNDWHYWETSPYCLPKQGEINMKIEVKKFPQIKLAVMEHKGDPKLVGESVNKLISWAKAQPIDLKPKPGEAFGIAYDDPKNTPPSEFRFDLGIKVPENFKLSDKVIEKFLPAGNYAVAIHQGSRDKIADTIYPMYREWLPNTDYQLGNFPCIFCYHNFDHEVAETELLTECRILLEE
ncbi:MAG: AraC family transcriptional regulator [Pseudomonadota bacterium]